MDSVTQFVLGASVSAALLGQRLSWRAVVLGGVVATLPDLDSFLPSENVIDAVTYHRGFSHSLVVQTAVSPIIAVLTGFIYQRFSVPYWLMLLTVWLCLITHSLLDSLTTYGTQLLWPLEAGSPFAFPSVFIIDPFYTVTLIVGLVMFFIFQRRKRFMRAERAVMVCLTLSTAYLGAGMMGHMIVKSRAEAHPLLAGKQIHVQPTPFNILYWQVLAVDDKHYYTGATSAISSCGLLDIKSYDRVPVVAAPFVMPANVKRYEWFTNGFYNYQITDAGAQIVDLRIGFAPFYPFSFQFARKELSDLKLQQPSRGQSQRRSLSYLTDLYNLARVVPKGCW